MLFDGVYRPSTWNLRVQYFRFIANWNSAAEHTVAAFNNSYSIEGFMLKGLRSQHIQIHPVWDREQHIPTWSTSAHPTLHMHVAILVFSAGNAYCVMSLHSTALRQVKQNHDTVCVEVIILVSHDLQEPLASVHKHANRCWYRIFCYVKLRPKVTLISTTEQVPAKR